MASKLLLKRHQTLIRLAQWSQAHARTLHSENPISTLYLPLQRLHSLLHSRPYSETSQPTTVNRSTVATKRKSVSSSLNEAELAKFSAIAETWVGLRRTIQAIA
nr:ubiquinone biosynthesis O-methyltransferase, mitochondrial-like [Ipomoea batatas]GMD66989.1 ubiquinone biosynthesis O-methyltransferase, mitochondrial-like [Ipomoea batatas]